MFSLLRENSIGKLGSQLQIVQNVLREGEVMLILGDSKGNRQEK